MKYLVVSDNHGDRQILVDILEAYQNKIDVFFHCGDSELSSDDSLWQSFHVVRGNCDYGGDFSDSVVVKTPLDTIFMTHGHLADVRFGLTNLGMQAQKAEADLVLFGHTHQIACEMVGKRLFLNPGSISQPRGPIQIKSFAIIESTEEIFDVCYYDREFTAISDLHFSYKKK